MLPTWSFCVDVALDVVLVGSQVGEGGGALRAVERRFSVGQALQTPAAVAAENRRKRCHCSNVLIERFKIWDL